ncbi:MAG: ABC transporter permease [Candidatus Promineifilaceae bacterium]
MNTQRLDQLNLMNTVVTLTTTILNETHKGLMLAWNYKVDLILEVFIMGFSFIGLSFLVGGGRLEGEQLSASLIGYLVWFFAIKAISDMSSNLKDEMQAGTLEQMFMSPTDTGFLVLGRSMSTLLTTTVIAALIAIGPMFLLKIRLPLSPAAVPVFIITISGLYGFGFAVGGFTLIYKQANSLSDLVQYGLVFLNGALLPIDRFPSWLAFIARLLPTTQGIIVLRQVTVDGMSLAETWQAGTLVWLIIHSAVFLLLGWLIFKWCEKIARQRGLLGQY